MLTERTRREVVFQGHVRRRVMPPVWWRTPVIPWKAISKGTGASR